MYYSCWLDLASVARLHKEVLDFIRYHSLDLPNRSSIVDHDATYL